MNIVDGAGCNQPVVIGLEFGQSEGQEAGTAGTTATTTGSQSGTTLSVPNTGILGAGPNIS